MKKSFRALISILITLFLLIALYKAIANAEEKEVILSTVDIDKDYEILGLVSYRSSELEPEKIHKELKKQAEKMGADYIIGITYYSNAGYLYGSGTAVKLIKENSPKR